MMCYCGKTLVEYTAMGEKCYSCPDCLEVISDAYREMAELRKQIRVFDEAFCKLAYKARELTKLLRSASGYVYSDEDDHQYARDLKNKILKEIAK